MSNNQAESFFARVRRFIIGQVHRVTPHYIGDYINEVAWREDNRRKRPSEQVKDLVRFSSRGTSEKWRGYWNGKDRLVGIKASAAATARQHYPLTSLDVSRK